MLAIFFLLIMVFIAWETTKRSYWNVLRYFTCADKKDLRCLWTSLTEPTVRNVVTENVQQLVFR